MTRRIRFLVSVVLLSPAVFFLWSSLLREHYYSALEEIVGLVWQEVGPANVSIPSSVDNMVPLLVLMLATPAVPVWRRLRGLAYGVGILLVAHILVVIFTTSWVSETAPSQLDFFLSLLASTTMVALPFLIWVVLSWDQVKTLVLRAQGPTAR